MTRDEFKAFLKSEVTIDGALSINLPDATYDRVIDKELKTMYEINPDSMEDSYCVIPRQYFYTPEFRKSRTIQFPDCVLTVVKFVEMKRRNAMFGTVDPDFGFNRAFQSDLWFGSQMSMDTVAFRTIQWSVWDQLKTFTLVDIQHRWNYAEHNLLVLGHDPRMDVFCQMNTKADAQALFDNIWVQKWVAAHCKLEANKVVTFMTTNLIGNTTLNMSAYLDAANKDIEDCKNKFLENSKVPHIWTMP